MNPPLIPALALAWVAILAGGWLGGQLLRQNGRILLRLDELEKRLNELEFGGADELEGLPLGSEAPAFELADPSGERKSLGQFRGQPVLLIFFNPNCGFCRELMPKLAGVAAGFQPASEGGILPPDLRSTTVEIQSAFDGRGESDAVSAGLEARLTDRQGCPPPQLLILTTGAAEKNRQFFAEHKISCPVLMQNDGEVAKAYQANGTPTGYLVSADGKIASELAIGAEALLKLASQPARELPLTLTLSPSDGEKENTDGDGRVTRFSNRSLARSKIKRDGLKAGTPAPDFRLPRLDGRGELALSDLRGRRVLLVFSSPQCGPCDALAPALQRFHRQHPELELVMISRSEPKENRAKIKEHGLTFPVLSQQQWEISRRYAMFATPVAYLIDEAGVITHDVAVGVEPILLLLSEAVGWFAHTSPKQDEERSEDVL